MRVKGGYGVLRAMIRTPQTVTIAAHMAWRTTGFRNVPSKTSGTKSTHTRKIPVYAKYSAKRPLCHFVYQVL